MSHTYIFEITLKGGETLTRSHVCYDSEAVMDYIDHLMETYEDVECIYSKPEDK